MTSVVALEVYKKITLLPIEITPRGVESKEKLQAFEPGIYVGTITPLLLFGKTSPWFITKTPSGHFGCDQNVIAIWQEKEWVAMHSKYPKDLRHS